MIKHVLFVASSLLLAHASLNAQVRNAGPFTSNGGEIAKHRDPAIEHRGSRDDAFWSEDFANGFPAGWTVQETTGDCPWRYSVDGSYGFFNGNGGVSSGDTIQSTSAANGFLICDVDSANNTVNGQPANTTYLTYSSYFTTSAIDLTGHPNVKLEFEQLFRYNGASSLDVMVSTDNANWTSYDVKGTVGTNELSANPMLASVNISAVAGNQPVVYLKIGWSSRAYYWQIDDMRIVEAPENDMKVVEGFITNARASYDDYDAMNLEYTYMPLAQASPMTFGAHVVNNGSVTQTNIVVTATINGTDYSSAPYPSLAAGAADTILFQSAYTPSATGTYTATITVSADAPDFDDSNNSTTRTWNVTDADFKYAQMGQDGDARTTSTVISTAEGIAYSSMGSKMEIQEEGSVAYGIGVVLGTGSKVGTFFSVALIEDTPDGLTTIAVSDVVAVTQDMLVGAGGNHVTYLPFDPVLSDPGVVPAPLDPAKDYVAFIQNDGPDSVVIAQGGNAGKGGLWSFDNADATYVQYIGAGNKAAMVRLFLADGSTVGVSEIPGNNGLTLGPNMPNPFTGSTAISYSLNDARKVTLEVFDVTGNRVLSRPQGIQSSGTHLIDLDGASLAQGVYTYTLTAGSDRLSRRMVVTK